MDVWRKRREIAGDRDSFIRIQDTVSHAVEWDLADIKRKRSTIIRMNVTDT